MPDRLAGLAARWSLHAVAPLAQGGTGARLFAVTAPQGPAVLKLALPGQAVRAEADALAGFGGEGAARLLAADPDQGALLLERISPGAPLAALDDDAAATRIAAHLMRRLRRPPPAGALLATAAGWVRLLDRAWAEAWPGLPRDALARAAALFRALAATAPAPVLLHGDLHHGNILADGAGWRAVDPRGLVGDPAFEAAALLRNPPGAPAVAQQAAQRLGVLAEEAGLDRDRIAGWGFAGAMLAAGWAVEDAEDPAPWLAAATALAPFAPDPGRLIRAESG